MNIIDTRALWSSKKLSSDYLKEQLLASNLEMWLRSAQCQIDRIEIAKKALGESLKKSKISQTMDNSWVGHQQLLFMDIHFFLIAMANVAKVMETMKKLRSYDPDYVKIYKENAAKLNRLKHVFRNSLEHITGNYLEGVDKKGNPLKNPRDLGNLEGDTYSLFGEKFHLPSTFIMLAKLVEDLESWSDQKVREFYSHQSHVSS